jgi:indole-3-glycerol phosphate synthase
MDSRLVEILSEKRKQVRRLRKTGMLAPRTFDASGLRDFRGAISRPDSISLIAEIKFASPSEGIIRENADPLPIAHVYEEAGAAAISLVTDTLFFGGDIAKLPRLKEEISLPILRKDFIIDEVQVIESSFYGADALLLIARILSRQQLHKLLHISRELGLAPLTEVHDRNDLEKAIDCGAEIIGINNRDLGTLEVDLQTTLELASLVPENRTIISESGIMHSRDIGLFYRSGIHAVLVGTSLMKSKDTAKKTRELVRAGKAGIVVRGEHGKS